MAQAARDDENWKQKYLDYLDQSESREKQWKQDEALLKHSLGRVALAADGIDNDLDHHLKKLRKLLRKESSYEQLKETVTSISSTVKILDESSHAKTSTASLLSWLVDNVDLPKKYKRNTNKLKKNLAALESNDSAEIEFESYSKLLNEVLLALQGDSRSWLQKVFTDKNDLSIDKPTTDTSSKEEDVSDVVYSAIGSELLDQLVTKFPRQWLDSTQSDLLRRRIENIKSKQAIATVLDDIVQTLQNTVPDQTETKQESNTNTGTDDSPQMLIVNQFCLKLLETLNFPQDLQEPAIALRDRVVDGIANTEIPGILKAIADLVITIRNRIENEKNSLQEFLLQLSGHLNDIDSNLSGVINTSLDSSHADEKFNQQISQEMESLSESILNANSLELLKQSVQDRVHAIQTHISENQNSLFVRQENLEIALNKSSARLKKLELEGNTLRDQLQKEHAQATHDVLTGLHNRLAYEEHIHMEFSRWQRYQKPLSMLIFDIDNFKNINDTYGHKAGDNALRLIAKKLNSNIRDSDFIARFGGEEFVVLMPETSIIDAMPVAEKLRLLVADVSFNYKDKPVPITISCGGAEFRLGDSIDTTFERADQALYHAKKLGRNQCYTDPTDS